MTILKTLGNVLHRTPWWALFTGGLLTMLTLALVSLPVNVLRLTKSGESAEMRRAIKVEIDNAFGESALGVAEGVVTAMRERATDPARKAELDQALERIAESRAELFEDAAEAARSGKDAARESANAAREAARDVARSAIEGMRDAAETAKELAEERLDTLQSARRDVAQALASAKVPADAALKQIDAQISEARAARDATAETLRALDAKLSRVQSKLGPAPQPPAPPTPPTPPNPSTGAASGATIKGNIVLAEGGDQVDIPTPPAPPAVTLTPELRNEIRTAVSRDVRRMGIGGALILIFLPLFVMTLIAKFFIDRSHRMQTFAVAQQEVAESQSARRQIMEAKLQALQAQVEPHFLYNTLANVQALTEVDPPAANKMVGHLIEYLRSALPKMRENTSTVGQEIELVRAYLNILKMRMGARLSFDIDCAPDVALLPFPPLMLPSLVENAVKHGLEPMRDGGRIDVVASREGERLRVVVRDTGRGLGEETTPAGSGVGLDNLRERLLAMFGDAATLTLESNTPQGVIATIVLPASGAPLHAPAVAAPATAQTFAGKTWKVAAKTHSIWVTVLMKTFLVTLIVLGALFLFTLVAMATNTLPMEIFGTSVGGLDGMAIGTVVLVIAFAAIALALLLVFGIVYGLGFLVVALLIGIPVLILISMFPVLAPFALGGMVVYWFWVRKKKAVAKETD